MSIASGTRLGAYEVSAKIGEGGMGEVYRATDTNLKRQVAMKVLPAAVAADADRLARFQREASEWHAAALARGRQGTLPRAGRRAHHGHADRDGRGWQGDHASCAGGRASAHGRVDDDPRHPASL